MSDLEDDSMDQDSPNEMSDADDGNEALSSDGEEEKVAHLLGEIGCASIRILSCILLCAWELSPSPLRWAAVSADTATRRTTTSTRSR